MNIPSLKYSQILKSLITHNLSKFLIFFSMEEQKRNKMCWINNLTEEYLLVLGLFYSIYKPHVFVYSNLNVL